MTLAEAAVGQRVRSTVSFSGVPKGTEGVIDEDYGTGVMVAWDLPGQPLPKDYAHQERRAGVRSAILRDGFDKARDLQFLEAVL